MYNSFAEKRRLGSDSETALFLIIILNVHICKLASGTRKWYNIVVILLHLIL